MCRNLNESILTLNQAFELGVRFPLSEFVQFSKYCNRSNQIIVETKPEHCVIVCTDMQTLLHSLEENVDSRVGSMTKKCLSQRDLGITRTILLASAPLGIGNTEVFEPSKCWSVCVLEFGMSE